MNISVTEFKARCTRLLRELPELGEPMRITNHGRVIAVVEVAERVGATLPAWGGLRDSVRKVAKNFDAPEGDGDWESAR